MQSELEYEFNLNQANEALNESINKVNEQSTHNLHTACLYRDYN